MMKQTNAYRLMFLGRIDISALDAARQHQEITSLQYGLFTVHRDRPAPLRHIE
jgi:hypothetical protein